LHARQQPAKNPKKSSSQGLQSADIYGILKA
jgi:hypothetical protein